MIDYSFTRKNTWVHRLDPRTKLFICGCGFIFVITPLSLPSSLLLVLGGLILSFLARNFSNIWAMRYVMALIFIFSSAAWYISSGLSGLVYGINVGIRLSAAVIFGIFLLVTAPAEDILLALVRLHLPYRFCFALSTALRLFPTIIDIAYTVIEAQKMRGHDIRSGFILSRIKKHVPLIVPVLAISLRRTNLLAMALESRAFGASPSRSFLREIHFHKRDLWAALGTAAWLIMLLIVNFLLI